VQFSKTLIDFRATIGRNALNAGVQFSKTLIDFSVARSTIQRGWGSVLKNPDRLHKRRGHVHSSLGFSSQKPDRLQVAKKSCLTWFFGLPEV
ncbi:hypothetical protein ACQX3M_08885, partial [Corynebacterium diphtheriae]